MNNHELKFFYGSSNPELGKKIAENLGIKAGKTILKKFSNGETYFQFAENVRGNDLFLMQTGCEPINDYLMELLIMVDAARRSSASRITVVMPNYFYARQDRKTASREPITAKLVADLITTAGADRILTMDLHSDQIQGFFNIPLDNLPTRTMLVDKALKISGKNSVIISPDAGGAKAATKISYKKELPLAIINKIRLKHNEAQCLEIIGENVKGKNCLIFDDMVDTAGSLCGAADLLKKKGAKKIYGFATHGILSGNAIEKLENSKIDKLFITDTLPLKKESKKIEIISISKYLANAIKCVHNNESVSLLFKE